VIKLRRIGWAGQVAWERWKYVQNFSWKASGKRPSGRPRNGRENIKMDLKEIGYEDMAMIHLTQDRK
jgi:hypothetical protein